ncbi:hypothetical protein [Halobaculum litoreum]|uniref:Uncharacterized protein n=1 Tax=Halobaculum litoreum TaxID=3031998 RepID=A0ABD5XQM5_9EURY|nr:hypothetical protein [Halobaculum sp. DT92]
MGRPPGPLGRHAPRRRRRPRGRRARGPALGTLAVAALAGGLAGYFLLLAGVVSGALPEPATWFADRED